MKKSKETVKPAKEIERLVNYEEASAITGLSVSFLKKARQQYGLPIYKMGSLVKLKVSELERWISDRKAVS